MAKTTRNMAMAMMAGAILASPRGVARVYRELGVEVRWIAPLVELDRPNDILNETLIATVHLRLFERDGSDRAFNGVIGIDAPRAAGGLTTVAHVLSL